MAIAGSLALFREGTPHPSVYTLIPVVGTALVLVFAREGTIVARILSLKPMVGIGLISYSAYFWHQPLFAFAHHRWLTAPSLGLMLALSAMALLLAWATWRFVERPFRKLGPTPATVFPTRRGALAGAAAGIAVACSAGVVLHVKHGFPARVPEEALHYREARWDYNPLRDVCHLDARMPVDVVLPQKGACQSANTPAMRNAAIVGDSHADAIANPVRAILEARVRTH